ncbi:hypothetical protein TruAng_002425 [Truncatella angustata]|nr:hypothetical protein TruAng_002425 [Truncatella angustata]
MLLLGLEQSQRLDPLKSPKVASLRSVTPLNANRAGAERQPLALALVRPFVITPQLQKGAAVVGAGACVLAKEEDDCDASLTRRASHHHHHRRCRRQAFPSTPPSSSVEKDRGCSKPFCAPPALDALQEDLRIQSLSLQSDYPGPLTPGPIDSKTGEPPTEINETAQAQDPTPTQQQQQHRPKTGRNLLARKDSQGLLQSPFRAHAAENRQPLRPAAARLWNPTNSTPRPSPSSERQRQRQYSTRRRQSSSPPLPPLPLQHPAFNITTFSTQLPSSVSGDLPLLELPEQLQDRLSPPPRASLQVDTRPGGEHRVSLPSSVRYSYDDKRISTVPSLQNTTPANPPRSHIAGRSRTSSFQQRARALSFGLVRPERTSASPKAIDKGKAIAVMAVSESGDPRRSVSKDLERGPDVLPRHSTTMSIPEGLSAISSSNSSIMGDPDQQDLGDEWGPQHPCYPHLNPHVPINSAEYTGTRIIRVRRDWLVEGDLAPTFSNLYPEILDPAGVSEQEFRRIIEKLNGELVPIFNPYNWRNMVDGVLGLLTGWIWDDLGLTNTKSRLKSLESWIDKWNIEMEKTLGAEDSIIAPRIISLRRTGYMNLDIQIPDPEIAPAASQPTTRSGPPESPDAAGTTEYAANSP